MNYCHKNNTFFLNFLFRKGPHTSTHRWIAWAVSSCPSNILGSCKLDSLARVRWINVKAHYVRNGYRNNGEKKTYLKRDSLMNVKRGNDLPHSESLPWCFDLPRRRFRPAFCWPYRRYLTLLGRYGGNDSLHTLYAKEGRNGASGHKR